MARFTITIRTPWSQERAFDYVADFRNFERWDPGVKSSTLAVGDEPGAGAAYDVKVPGTVLRYETREFERPSRTAIEATSALLHSYDTVQVAPAEDGSEVVYDASLELNGVLGVADPLVGLFFKRTVDKAGAGLAKAMEGSRVS